MSPNASHRVRPGLSSAASLITTLLISFDQEVLNQHLNLVTPEYPFFESPWPIQQVYFPEHGIVSILADTSQGRIEVGMIGPEGMAGLPVVLGIERSPHGYMVQAAGEALRIPAQDLRTALRQSSSLQAGFLRYAYALMVQTAYANAGFTIEARLARWILMTD